MITNTIWQKTFDKKVLKCHFSLILNPKSILNVFDSNNNFYGNLPGLFVTVFIVSFGKIVINLGDIIIDINSCINNLHAYGINTCDICDVF